MAEIKKIVFDIDGKKLEMSPEEAKELFEILKELYGSDENKTRGIPYPVPYPQPYPVYPRPRWEWIPPPYTTSGYWETRFDDNCNAVTFTTTASSKGE